MAFQMAGVITAGGLGGFYLDKWLALTFPVFTIVLLMIAVAGAIYLMIKDLLKK